MTNRERIMQDFAKLSNRDFLRALEDFTTDQLDTDICRFCHEINDNECPDPRHCNGICAKADLVWLDATAPANRTCQHTITDEDDSLFDVIIH